MASQLHKATLEIAPAVGLETEVEFTAFVNVYQSLPDLERIFLGKGDGLPFPTEPSVRYATTIALAIRAGDATQAYNAFTWISQAATVEWVQLFAVDLFRSMRSKGQMGTLAQLVKQNQELQKFMQDFQGLVAL
jgi:hypothetical protein